MHGYLWHRNYLGGVQVMVAIYIPLHIIEKVPLLLLLLLLLLRGTHITKIR